MAVVKDEHICVVDAQVNHDFFRGCGPTIHNHGNHGLEKGLQIAWLYFDVLLSVVMSKVLGRLGIHIVELGKALLRCIIGIFVLYPVQKSNDTVEIVANREALTCHCCCLLTGRA